MDRDPSEVRLLLPGSNQGILPALGLRVRDSLRKENRTPRDNLGKSQSLAPDGPLKVSLCKCTCLFSTPCCKSCLCMGSRVGEGGGGCQHWSIHDAWRSLHPFPLHPTASARHTFGDHTKLHAQQLKSNSLVCCVTTLARHCDLCIAKMISSSYENSLW